VATHLGSKSFMFLGARPVENRGDDKGEILQSSVATEFGSRIVFRIITPVGSVLTAVTVTVTLVPATVMIGRCSPDWNRGFAARLVTSSTS
jgi:hypothetical protein